MESFMIDVSRRRFLLGSAATGAFLAAGCPPTARTGSAGSSAAAQARSLYDAIFERMLVASPELATGLGLDTGARSALKSRLSDSSPAGKLNLYAPLAAAQPQLRAIDRNALTGRDRGWLDTALWFAERANEAATFNYGAIGGYNYPIPYVISQLSGSYQSVPDFLDSQHKIESEADAQAYLDRLDQFARNVPLEVDAARADAARGVIPPTYIIDKALNQTRALRERVGCKAMATLPCRPLRAEPLRRGLQDGGPGILVGRQHPHRLLRCSDDLVRPRGRALLRK